jgi:hypothetical protein
MSGRLVRRVLQEREASPQDPAAAAEDGLVVVEEEEEEEEAASPRRVAARNPFDLLDDDDDEAEDDKVRSSPHRALLVRVYLGSGLLPRSNRRRACVLALVVPYLIL